MSPKSPSMDRYQEEDDHRTITRAAEVMTDRKRMVGVKRQHRKMTKSMSLVQRSMLQGKR